MLSESVSLASEGLTMPSDECPLEIVVDVGRRVNVV